MCHSVSVIGNRKTFVSRYLLYMITRPLRKIHSAMQLQKETAGQSKFQRTNTLPEHPGYKLFCFTSHSCSSKNPVCLRTCTLLQLSLGGTPPPAWGLSLCLTSFCPADQLGRVNELWTLLCQIQRYGDHSPQATRSGSLAKDPCTSSRHLHGQQVQ